MIEVSPVGTAARPLRPSPPLRRGVGELDAATLASGASALATTPAYGCGCSRWGLPSSAA